MRDWIRRSFKNRIFITVLLVTLVPMLLCDVFIMQISMRRSGDMLYAQAQSELDTAAGIIDSALDTVDGVTAKLAGSSVIRSALHRGRESDLLYQLMYRETESLNGFASIDVYDSDGARIYAGSLDSEAGSLPVYWGVLRAARECEGQTMQANGADGLVIARAVYGSDGSIRFDLPWKQTEEPSGPSAPDGASRTPDAPDDSPDVIIDEPEPPAKPELTELHGAELSESVLRGSADAALAAVPEGANAVALRVKNAQGELLYDSALQEAIDVNAVKGGSGANAVIEALTGSEVYTIARINATHDSLYSFAHMADAGVLQLNYAGYIWYDPDSTFYLAPEKSAARQYIVSVARECAELGFDELLFDEFGYPTRGRLNNIDESARTLSKSAALAQLAEELRSGTEAYGVRLSVQLDAATVLAGGNETAGQDLAALAAVFDRIYVETTAEQLPALTAALEPYDAELVPILSEAPASGSYLLTA